MIPSLFAAYSLMVRRVLPRSWRMPACVAAAVFVAAAPAHAGPLLKKEATAYRQAGQQLQAAGQIDEAIDAYAKAVLCDPSSSEAHNDLGVMYEAKGWLANAEAEYLRALQLNANDRAAHTNLALLYEQQGRTREAVPHWQRRVTMGPPDDPWVRDARERLARHGASVPDLTPTAPRQPVKPVKAPKPPAVKKAAPPKPVAPKPLPPAPLRAGGAAKALERPSGHGAERSEASEGARVAKSASPGPTSVPERPTPKQGAIAPAKPAVSTTAISQKAQDAVVRQEIALRKADAARRREAQRQQALVKRQQEQAQRAAQRRQAQETKRQRQERQRQEREAAKLAKQHARELAQQRPAPVKASAVKASRPAPAPSARPAAAPQKPLLVPAQPPVAAQKPAPAAKPVPAKPAPAIKPVSVVTPPAPAVKPTSVPERPAPKPVVAPAPKPVTPISTAAQAKTLTDQIARERQRASDLMTRELYQRGLILYRQQQYAKAIEQFRRALEMDPNHRESQQYLREAQTALARGGK